VNKQRGLPLAAIALALLFHLRAPGVEGCTNLLVTRGASVDGSVMITYTCDGVFHPRLHFQPAADHEPGDSLEIVDWHGKVRGKIEQVPHTYAYIRLMNEHQLAISETTFDGRPELENPEGLLHYWDLMQLALQRAKTAREAIGVMTDLVAEYGYRSTGETFSIADPEEAWILEMIGPGPGGEAALWVARRIPDGMISSHANKARIGEFPLDDPEDCLFAENVISFAIEKGYYDPSSGEAFRFCDVYCPPTPKNRRYASARVWSIFRRAAPSLDLSPHYHRSVEGAEPYPLWIEPDEKLGLEGVFALMRDHYEGTPYDMTEGVDAGPFGTPNRWRPITWTVDSLEYAWERPVSTQQTGFSLVAQCRAHLPDPVGGVTWYGVDDTYTTCYVPLYCGIDDVPGPFAIGSLDEYDRESAWWVFNFVANYANLKYSYMIQDIQAVQRDLEGYLIALQPAVEKTAEHLAAHDPDLLTRYLTDFSQTHAEMVVSRWRELGDHLVAKYNDGYVRDEEGKAEEVGYPEGWLRRVLEDEPDRFRLQEKPADVPETRLVD